MNAINLIVLAARHSLDFTEVLSHWSSVVEILILKRWISPDSPRCKDTLDRPERFQSLSDDHRASWGDRGDERPLKEPKINLIFEPRCLFTEWRRANPGRVHLTSRSQDTSTGIISLRHFSQSVFQLCTQRQALDKRFEAPNGEIQNFELSKFKLRQELIKFNQWKADLPSEDIHFDEIPLRLGCSTKRPP